MSYHVHVHTMYMLLAHLCSIVLQDREEEEDNASIGTIYENVDNLVMQFDSTMQATVQAMGQVGQQLKSNKKHKKKERSLLRQTSFFKGSKSQKSKLTSKQKSELEKGESHSGYLYKKSASGSWKKKWCVLKGAVLSYSKLDMYMYMYLSEGGNIVLIVSSHSARIALLLRYVRICTLVGLSMSIVHCNNLALKFASTEAN